MKFIRQVLLVMIGVLIIGEGLSARVYSCKMEELLDKTSLKYNLYFETSGVKGINNFLQLYQSNIKVYNKIYNYLKTRKDIKELLTCSNTKQCDAIAKTLAKYATYTITFKEKENLIWFMIGQSSLGAGNMMWSEAKNAYKISANTFLEPYKNILDYLINFTDYNIQVDTSYINQKNKDTISKLLQNLLPTYSEFVKNPYNYDNISEIADDVSKIAAILQLNKSKNYLTLTKDIASLKNEIQYANLYAKGTKNLIDGNSCIKIGWFTNDEIDYLNNIPAVETQKILFTITDVIKDIADILHLEKLSGIIETLSSAYKGVSFTSAAQRTDLGNILTFGGLINNKLKYNNKDLKELINQLSELNIYKFIDAIYYRKTKYIVKFLNNYNKNLNYFKNDYTNEVLKPQQNNLISIALRATIFNNTNPGIDSRYFIEQKRYTYVDSNKRYFPNYIPFNATLYTNQENKINKLLKISVWGRQGKTQNFDIDSNGFYQNAGEFLFNKNNAFHVPNTNIYYYKYMTYDENNNPIYIFANNRILRGNKFTYNNGKFYIGGNYGVMFFIYDKTRASFKKIIHKYYAPYFENYAINHYYNAAGLLKNITIADFQKLRKIFNNYILNKKFMNLNAFKSISNLNVKLDVMSKENNYIPLSYAYAYFYSIDRILYNKEISSRVLSEVLKNNPQYISLVRKHMVNIINQQVGYLRVHSTLKAFNSILKGLKNETK